MLEDILNYKKQLYAIGFWIQVFWCQSSLCQFTLSLLLDINFKDIEDCSGIFWGRVCCHYGRQTSGWRTNTVCCSIWAKAVLSECSWAMTEHRLNKGDWKFFPIFVSFKGQCPVWAMKHIVHLHTCHSYKIKMNADNSWFKKVEGDK